MFNGYWEFEKILITKLKNTPYVRKFIYEDNIISCRITLYLLIIGMMAIINEVYINIEMIMIQKQTYEELDKGYIDENYKLIKILKSDDYHSKEFYDERQGIIFEEFEDKDKFFAKPVHVSEINVKCHIINYNKIIKFHLEFTPEEFEEEKRIEFGCNLYNLKLRLLHLIEDSDIIDDSKKKINMNNIKVYNHNNEELDKRYDSIQLCFLKIETGDTIRCDVNV